MDVLQIVTVLTNAPLAMVLLYLLIKEQTAHIETRIKRDEELRVFMERFAGLAERVAAAVERLDLPGQL